MIAVVDSGVANLASVMAALRRLGSDAEITSDAEKIRAADRVILPGVGSARAAMAQLEARNLIDVLRALTQPMLGICLGMQLLYARSDEGGGVDGLGVLPGTVKRLEAAPGTPVPHMGWNQLKLQDRNHRLFRGVNDDCFVYFVHSYAAPVSPSTLAVTTYGEAFTSVVGRDNFFGCQFHPERSSAPGHQILTNFLEM